MKEVAFIRQNIDKWRDTEVLLKTLSTQTPDELADAYVEVTSDLAFSQSHYPKSRITLYLNGLASSLHQAIYRNRRERWTRIITFWTREVPATMWRERRCLLASFLIFTVSVAIGAVSQWHDTEFARLILGDGYVDMTLENIRNGTPMAVYNGSKELPMFFGITMNNIYVSFLIFAGGVLTSFMTGYLLMQNGIMLGAFQAFFFQHGIYADLLLAVWLHGTLEISAVIVAGAGGLAIGNGWLFPGTYPRMMSFRMGARRGLKIVVGTVPLFVVAGFIESFFTRHTEWNNVLRLAVILCSLTFVVGYYIYLPYKRRIEELKDFK